MVTTFVCVLAWILAPPVRRFAPARCLVSLIAAADTQTRHPKLPYDILPAGSEPQRSSLYRLYIVICAVVMDARGFHRRKREDCADFDVNVRRRQSRSWLDCLRQLRSRACRCESRLRRPCPPHSLDRHARISNDGVCHRTPKMRTLTRRPLTRGGSVSRSL
jgi:hypothetical protein